MMMRYEGLNVMWENIKTNFSMIDDLTEVVSDSSKIVSALKSTQNLIIKRKIQTFVENLEKISSSDLKSFISSIEYDEDKKTVFLESIKKAIDVDDELQIYLLAYLANIYKTNKKLNYYEKQLFYNINTLSEDDFKIFFCTYEDQIKNNKTFITLTSYVEKEIISISLNKFAHLGLTHIGKNSIDTYEIGKYSETFFQCLQKYFTSSPCDEIVEKIQYGKISGGFVR